MNDDVTLREIVRQEFVGVTESDTVAETLSLLADEREACAVVLRSGQAIGIAAPPDLYHAVAAHDLETTPITAVMRDPPPTLAPGDHVEAASKLLVEADTPRILVTDDGDVVGLIDARDVLAVKTARPDAAPMESTVTGPPEPTGERYSSQSICERCGSLSRELSEFNGQLLCPDCRSV